MNNRVDGLRLVQNYFQLPNIIVDDLLSELSGAELKCYLLVVRKTRGWCKSSDAISISQFIEATGLSNRTVIDACKSLVDMGLMSQKTGRRGVNVYSLDYENFTGDDATSEKSSQVTSEKSSHTKNTLKNTPSSPTSGVIVSAKKQASSADSATCSSSAKNNTENITSAPVDAMSRYTTTDQPTSRSMVTVDETWRPSKAFFTLLSYTGRRDAELTPELIAKFILENNGQKAMQGTLEKRLLSWVIREENAPRNGSQGQQRGNATNGRRSTNWHSDINNVKHGESGSF